MTHAPTSDRITALEMAGFSFRPFAGPADYELMAQVAQASNLADDVIDVATPAGLANDIEHVPDFDFARDLLLAEADGRLAGYVMVASRAELEGDWIYRMYGHVAPEFRRRGLGRALLRWAEQRLRAIAQAHPAGVPRYFHAAGADTRVGKHILFEQEGYRPARHFYEMERPSLDDLPPAELPPGLELRPALPEHYRLVAEAVSEAFRDHWGFVPPTEADYQGWFKSSDFDPSLWQVAWDVASGQVAGASINIIDHEKNAQYHRLEGYIDDLGVRRPWRRRGLGRALLLHSLHLFKARGMTSAGLGVDVDNPNGALRLYEDVGFRAVKHAMALRKPF
jgi:mycothiol synthase